MTNANVIVTVRPVRPEVSILDIKGEINSFAESALMGAYAQLDGTRNILLNFSGLSYMNSSGIGLLVTLLIRCNRQQQRLLACNLTNHYRQIFELTRLNEAISIFPTEAEALATVN